MKKSFWILAVGLVAMVVLAHAATFRGLPVAGLRSALIWDNEEPWETTTGFRVSLATKDSIGVTNVFSVTNRVDLTNVMAALPNGLYRLNVFTEGLEADESAASETLWFLWHAHSPKAATNLAVEFSR